jgi:prolyl 4-hydroxylase
MTYGIRVYRGDNVLINHVDRKDTHLASAVIQIEQNGKEGWPLEIKVNKTHRVEVYLQPGEMVLYEGAAFQHGRPMRFNGTSFSNIFSHYHPEAAKDGHSFDREL